MPATSTTQIANLALSHLGIGMEISDLGTENSTEAAACRLHYQPVLDTLLERHPWAWANATATLALVDEDPTQEWTYSYRLPVNCAAPRRILSPLGHMDPNPIPFLRVDDASGGLIYCDEAEPVLEYTKLITNVALFPMVFVRALEWALAEQIAELLSAKPERAERARQMAEDWILKAMAADGNQSRNQAMPDSEFMRARL
jgi:hypothetical protein